MPEPLPVRQFHIHLAEPHPRVVIDDPLAERLPSTRPAAGRISHTPTLKHRALRLTPDEWMIPLFGDSMADGKRFVLEGRLISIAL